MDASDALATRELCFSYAPKLSPILQNITFRAPKGSITAFLGPNGAGKTTTIKCLLGLLPANGHIEIYGETDPVEQRKHVGSMVESPSFYPHLSALDNLEIFASIGQHQVTTAELKSLLEQVGLVDRASDRVGQYSMGMKQRLGIARSLVGKPKILILDEPTNGLDPRGMHDIRVLIQRLQTDHQLSVLLSTHLLSEAEAICDWVVVIDKGRIRAGGNLKTLSGTQPHFRIHHSDQDELMNALSRMPIVVHHVQDALDVIVQIKDGNGSDLNRELAQHGIYVSTITTENNSLERVFLELTGGSNE